MKSVSTFPNAVEETENHWIPLPDGRQLAARIWRPVTEAPVPAILEYLPYRKRDGTTVRDALTHPWLAGHGYACLRVDMAGTGESDGLFDDEYSEQELSDGEAVLDWIAAQDWCSGAVGMIGISWGGFNGLQLAARRPEALKAVVSICSTADRYADDIHFKGGCILGENAGWAATVLGWFGLPPDPALRDDWREVWLRRLDQTPDLLGTWLRHQARDDYWRHGSVCEDYAAIEAPVLAVGGWHDGYRNTPFHLAANLNAPVKAIVGPWNHKYPHFGRPGPTIDFLGEMRRWFDRWLKGEPNGVEDDPALRLYLMDGIAPANDYDHRPGRWVTEDQWPAPRIETRTLHLTESSLADTPSPFVKRAETHTRCGLGTGEYFPFGFGPGELPNDQRADDALSVCFDGEPAAEAVDIVGAPRLTLTVAADRPSAFVAARLSDLAPDGAATLIAHGFLNLRHRNGHGTPEDLIPDKAVEASFDLDHCAYRLPAGHRLRIALSPFYWPFIWPEAENVTLTVTAGSLSIPVRPIADAPEWRFGEAEGAPPLPLRVQSAPDEAKTFRHDKATGQDVIEIASIGELAEDPTTGLVSGVDMRECWSIVPGQPSSARSDFEWDRTMARGDWRVRVRATLSQWAEGDEIFHESALTAWEGDDIVFDRRWKGTAGRD